MDRVAGATVKDRPRRVIPLVAGWVLLTVFVVALGVALILLGNWAAGWSGGDSTPTTTGGIALALAAVVPAWVAIGLLGGARNPWVVGTVILVVLTALMWLLFLGLAGVPSTNLAVAVAPAGVCSALLVVHASSPVRRWCPTPPRRPEPAGDDD
jgi:hypothetical protein